MQLQLKKIRDLRFGDEFRSFGRFSVRAGSPDRNSNIPYFDYGSAIERFATPDLIVAVRHKAPFLYNETLDKLQIGRSFRYRNMIYLLIGREAASVEVMCSNGSLVYLPEWALVSTTRP